MPEVGVRVERPIGRSQLRDPESDQAVEQQPTVVGVAGDMAVEFGVRRLTERREGGVLGPTRAGRW